MTIDPNEAAASLQDIATIERRTHEALCYGGSSAIFIMWGILVASGYGLTELYPRSARIIWLAVTALGCVGTASIIAMRRRARPQQTRDWRLVWAMAALAAFGAVWSYLLGPIVPRPLMYSFQPTLFLLGIILAGLWLGRFFVVIGLVGIALSPSAICSQPWLRWWMAAVQAALDRRRRLARQERRAMSGANEIIHQAMRFGYGALSTIIEEDGDRVHAVWLARGDRWQSRCASRDAERAGTS